MRQGYATCISHPLSVLYCTGLPAFGQEGVVATVKGILTCFLRSRGQRVGRSYARVGTAQCKTKAIRASSINKAGNRKTYRTCLAQQAASTSVGMIWSLPITGPAELCGQPAFWHFARCTAKANGPPAGICGLSQENRGCSPQSMLTVAD